MFEQYTEIGSLDVEDFNAGTIIPGSWRSEIHGANNGMQPLRNNIGARNYTQEAASKRDRYADFFLSRGAVPWQDQMIYDD
ncbi:hypothetical protein NQ314_008859 [Rhamnusium bicolor]|uniref:Uncharacterized protein n=1 Tax=Rhamnusium bicolor TaxID=1586634 RepID=A0AAV8Y5C0_9CUCU|nr:hypothetical protein NQ314_008859 [Rhamnusium bicolor]